MEPPNYNPQESLLSGGIEPIIKVMGGGSMPSNYNSEDSLLTGGIEPIVKVMGGGGDEPDIRILSNFPEEKEINKEFSALKTIWNENAKTNIPELDKVYNKLKVKFENTVYHYTKTPTNIVSKSTQANSKSSQVIVKFIPLSTNELIVLPPIRNSLENFLKYLYVLIKNNYFDLSTLKFKKRVFVVCLEPFYSSSGPLAIKDDVLKYLYLKIKNENFNSFFIANEPYSIVYPKDINGKGLLLSEKLSIPINEFDLKPIDLLLIASEHIGAMKYTKSTTFYDKIQFNTIYGSDVSSSATSGTPESYTFPLEQSIAIIELREKDYDFAIIDMMGKKYKIRKAKSSYNDKIFNLWIKGKYTIDEKELVNDLHLSSSGVVIPNFLLKLTLYNCFNDVSLLTKSECMDIRSDLQKIYKHMLFKFNNKALTGFTNSGKEVSTTKWNSFYNKPY